MRAACEDHKTGIVCQAIEKESGVDATEMDVNCPCSNAYSTGEFVTLQNVSQKVMRICFSIDLNTRKRVLFQMPFWHI